MTTITYKDNILASDSIVTTDSIVGTVKKLFKNSKGYFALSGNLSTATALLDWLMAGASIQHKPQLSIDEFCIVIHITNTGEVIQYINSCTPVRIESNFYAWGSGADFAKGALRVGASAEEAIEVAIEYDVYSGGKIQTMKVKKTP